MVVLVRVMMLLLVINRVLSIDPRYRCGSNGLCADCSGAGAPRSRQALGMSGQDIDVHIHVQVEVLGILLRVVVVMTV